MKLRLQAADYHRNGICGEPFRVALFRDETEKRDMLAIIPSTHDGDEERATGRCYVLDVDMLTQRNIRFGENSWRGDNYEAALLPLIKAELDRQREERLTQLETDDERSQQ